MSLKKVQQFNGKKLHIYMFVEYVKRRYTQFMMKIEEHGDI